ncbi:hypothetical protein CSC62_05470 [Pseudoxanthomonas jiangsuensis]|uniref:putative Ig domain-containing protein n=1 Tax=Pseudoxanthomonas jiangsuensis TaxID=619688 RepID=UPI00139209F5|nr:putative Ig domain-containing protein [Pseudoxanthomonas jiangsuensis]KAF1698358.1 hypothetical protein CSC62_05470 [Pseudoxanthomonas jiangsuensis]
MRNQPVPLVTGFYRDEDRPFSQQDVWNYLPCKTEAQGTRSPLMLKTPPGLFPWLEVAGAPPVRGIHDCEGKLYAVIGTTLYRISLSGVAIPIGTIPGTGRVSMDHNQRANGQQLTVVNGASGYVLDTYTGAFGKITDTGFPGSAVIKFMDGYMLGIDPAGRFAFNSAVAEATDYNTLDRWTSEYRPDRLVGMGRLGGELLLLSANSGEFFGVTSTAQQPYRSKRIFIDKGCAGPHTVVEADNSVFWLGSDGYFYQLDGYNPRRISKRPIEQAIRGMDWWNAFGFVWESEGHTVVYWTFLTGETWGWDCAQQEWHRRESYGLKRWRPSCTARSNGKWYAGDFQKGRIWRIDWGYVWEGDQEFISGFSQPVMHDNQNELIHSRVELVMDVGQVGPTPGAFPEQPEGPSISGAAPDGLRGAAYAGYTYTVTPGDAPISSTLVVSGELPPGLSFDGPTATIDDTIPTQNGEFGFTLRTTDTNGLSATLDDSIKIAQPVMLFASTLGDDGYAVIPPDYSPLAWTFSAPTIAYRANASGNRILTYSLSGGTRNTDNLGSSWANSTGDVGVGIASPKRGWGDGTVVLIPGGLNGGLYRSLDNGATFSNLNPPATSEVVVKVGSKWISAAGGNSNTLLVSTDNFTSYTTGATIPFNTSMSGSQAWSAGGVARFAGSINAPDRLRMTSTEDGVLADTESLPTLTATHFGGICANGDGSYWIAGTDLGEIIFKDGDDAWELGATVTGGVVDIKHNGLEFLVLTDANKIYSTADGVAMTERYTTLGPGLTGRAMAVPG